MTEVINTWSIPTLKQLLTLRATEGAMYATYVGVFYWGWANLNKTVHIGPAIRSELIDAFAFPNWVPLVILIACMLFAQFAIRGRRKILLENRPKNEHDAINLDIRFRSLWFMASLWVVWLPWIWPTMPHSLWLPPIFAFIAGTLVWLRIWSEAKYGFPVPAPHALTNESTSSDSPH